MKYILAIALLLFAFPALGNDGKHDELVCYLPSGGTILYRVGEDEVRQITYTNRLFWVHFTHRKYSLALPLNFPCTLRMHK